MNIDYLDTIRKVDAPPYLFTRIQQKIRDSHSATVPKKFAWAVALSCFVVLYVNISAVLYTTESYKPTTNIAQSMDLMPNNSFYK
ncbi:MAG: hypothetical protein JST20_00645 [Bacteroidetes bacterium]|nr:hypothetical protein [Bacteroidota bacterium]